MWPFSSKKETEDTTERLERLEKAMRRMEEDWSEVYGKFRTLQMRVAKQAQRAEQAQETPPEVQAGGREATQLTSLSPRAQLIQRQIEERRRNGG